MLHPLATSLPLVAQTMNTCSSTCFLPLPLWTYCRRYQRCRRRRRLLLLCATAPAPAPSSSSPMSAMMADTSSPSSRFNCHSRPHRQCAPASTLQLWTKRNPSRTSAPVTADAFCLLHSPPPTTCLLHSPPPTTTVAPTVNVRPAASACRHAWRCGCTRGCCRRRGPGGHQHRQDHLI